MTNLAVRATALASCLALTTGLTLAGVVIEFETRTAGHEKPDQAGTILVEADRLRMQGGTHDAIFRGDKQLLWTIDEKQGAYREMTKDQMKAVGDQAAGAMAELHKHMESLPPEQQKMVAEMMAGKMGPGAPGAAGAGKKEEPRTFVKTGKKETINGFPCVSYDAMRAGKREQELWITDWKRFDIKAADFQVFQDFAAFIKDAMGPLAAKFSTGFEQKFSDQEGPDSIPGVPVRVIDLREEGNRVTELKKISKESIPAAKFEVPAGLEKQPMMQLEHRRVD